MPNLTEYETVEDNVKTVFLGKYRVSKKKRSREPQYGKIFINFCIFLICWKRNSVSRTFIAKVIGS